MVGWKLMPSILIVDDEPAIRMILDKVFTRAGYRVRTAANGAEAMALFEHEEFDALLSDVVMPCMNGHELARWVAVNYPAVRTVLMSGYDLTCQKCACSPRCMLLNKPFNPREATQLVERVLGTGS
jgi:CheY-like chemotaxis protein